MAYQKDPRLTVNEARERGRMALDFYRQLCEEGEDGNGGFYRIPMHELVPPTSFANRMKRALLYIFGD